MKYLKTYESKKIEIPKSYLKKMAIEMETVLHADKSKYYYKYFDLSEEVVFKKSIELLKKHNKNYTIYLSETNDILAIVYENESIKISDNPFNINTSDSFYIWNSLPHKDWLNNKKFRIIDEKQAEELFSAYKFGI